MRLLCPWNFPGKNTGMDRHFLLQKICYKCLKIKRVWKESFKLLMGKEQLAGGGDGKMKLDFQCFDISAFSFEILLECFKIIGIYVYLHICIYVCLSVEGEGGERERLLMKNSHFCYAQFSLFMIVMSSKVATNQWIELNEPVLKCWSYRKYRFQFLWASDHNIFINWSTYHLVLCVSV